jgi:hypothetical protein
VINTDLRQVLEEAIRNRGREGHASRSPEKWIRPARSPTPCSRAAAVPARLACFRGRSLLRRNLAHPQNGNARRSLDALRLFHAPSCTGTFAYSYKLLHWSERPAPSACAKIAVPQMPHGVISA